MLHRHATMRSGRMRQYSHFVDAGGVFGKKFVEASLPPSVPLGGEVLADLLTFAICDVVEIRHLLLARVFRGQWSDVLEQFCLDLHEVSVPSIVERIAQGLRRCLGRTRRGPPIYSSYIRGGGGMWGEGTCT